MFISRAVARSLPRSSRSLHSVCGRRLSHLAAKPSRSITAIRSPTCARSIAAFSTSLRRSESGGQVNTELSAKLESEVSMEKDMRDTEVLPDHLKEYLDNTPFKLQDNSGEQEVVLTRTFGDEKIRVTFSIDDLNNADEDADQQMQDGSMQDELGNPSDMPTDTQSGGANTKGSINQGQTQSGNLRIAPEDKVSPADQEGEEAQEGGEQDQEPSFPAHVYITVERGNKGAMQIEAIAQDGLMAIDNVYFFKDASLVDPKSSEKENAASRMYTGPPFNNLDEDLQVLFEKFLDERGINTTMALFVPEYIDFKEQREYLSWLNNVKNFVD